jgi:ORF6N domain
MNISGLEVGEKDSRRANAQKVRNFSRKISIYLWMSQGIDSKIIIVREQRVIADSDLASLYGVSTKRLNEQVTRNIERFPADFMFSLNVQEVADLKSQIATSSYTHGHGGRRKLPRVFTEYGAVMAANVLNSKVAIQASIMLVRVFIKLKEVAQEHVDLKRRLLALEQRVVQGVSEHAEELQEVRFMIAQLEQPIESRKGQLGC